jgi:very-short-patch-repair endonuclease
MASDTPDREDIAVEKNKELTKRAQSLRKSQTKEESLLWYQFLCRYPIRFRRQYVIGNYIVDFYCHKAKLVVELDGSQHYSPDEIEYDRVRTRWLEMMGLRVIRFTNLEVMRQFRSVCEAIDMTVKQILGTEELG